MWIKEIRRWAAEYRKYLRGALLMLLAVILVCGGIALYLFRDVWNLDVVSRRIKYRNVHGFDTTDTFSFDAHNNNQYADFSGGLAVASVGGLSLYGADGHEVSVSQAQMSLPQIRTGGGLVTAYDAGGTALLAVDEGGGEVLRVSTEREILDVDVSEGGDVCYVSSEAGYRSVVTVYNDKQARIYRWLSTSTYLPLCAISENGTDLAAIGLNQENGSFVSTLNLFRTDSEEAGASVSLGSDLFYDIYFTKDDELCAIGETALQYLDTQGTALGTYDYSGRYLKDYHTGGDGFLTLSLNMYRAGNRYNLVTVNEAGEELGSVAVGQEILDLSAAGKYVAVLTPRGLTVYDRKLSVYAQTELTGAASAVLMRADGTALLLGAGEGRLFIP